MNSSVTSFGLKHQGADPLTPLIWISLSIHVAIFILVPVLGKLLHKPMNFAPPQTIQLVKPLLPQTQQAPAKALPEKKPKAASKPVPSKKPAQAAKKEEVKPEEDVEDLSDLLDRVQTPQAQIAVTGDFSKYGWYLLLIEQKIRSNWKPPVNKPDLFVMVTFTLASDGSVSNIGISQSCGIASLDNLAKIAVSQSAPFPRFPPGFSGSKQDFTCKLNAQGQ
jgi:protein TonB